MGMMMTPRGYLFVCSLVLLGSLAACSGPAIHTNDYDVAYSRGEVLFASKSKPIRVETFGQLTPGPALEEGALAGAVVRGLRRSGPQWFVGRYTADSAIEASDRRYKLRWLFNVPVTFPTRDTCADDAAAAASEWREPTGIFVAAFCRNERRLTWARGSTAGIESVTSAEFYELVGTTGRLLMPPRNPLLEDDCAIWPCT
jgi:hypothetical protein